MQEDRQEYFIKNIEIKKFKCFEDFKAEGFGRVNLIGGKNNVGKTAFMEALELIINSNDSYSLSHSLRTLLKRRQSTNRNDRYFELDFIYKDENIMELKTSNKNILVEYFEDFTEYTNELSEDTNLFIAHEPSLKLNVNNDEKIFSIDRIINRPIMSRRPFESNKETKINFITSSTINEQYIAILYGKLIDINKEDFLNESLQLFDSNIIALKQKATDRNIILKLSLKDREFPVLLSSLGEGVNRYIAILSAIWASQNGFLFIDEIENGLHYSNYSKLWTIILEASKQAKCQMFITTHSKECIESYARVAKKLEDKEITFFKLGKNQEGELKGMVYPYDWFIDSIEQEQEMRGW